MYYILYILVVQIYQKTNSRIKRVAAFVGTASTSRWLTMCKFWCRFIENELLPGFQQLLHITLCAIW